MRCTCCGWQGSSSEAATIPVQGALNDSQALRGMVNDLRTIMVKDCGISFLRFLLKWGFLREEEGTVAAQDRKLFYQYLAAMARGVMQAVLSETSNIEQERVRKEMSNG